MIYPAMNITAVAGARTDEQGLASGLFIAAFQIGSGVILGIVASVFTATAGYVTVGRTAYRAGILTSIGVATLALLICLVGVVRNPDRVRRQRPRRPSRRRRPEREIHPLAPGARRAPDPTDPRRRRGASC